MQTGVQSKRFDNQLSSLGNAKTGRSLFSGKPRTANLSRPKVASILKKYRQSQANSHKSSTQQNINSKCSAKHPRTECLQQSKDTVPVTNPSSLQANVSGRVHSGHGSASVVVE